MEYALEWANMLLRWLHVITAIAWIGASFYFVWLDNSLQTPPQWKQDRGIKGDLWAFHGGGIYEVAKYNLAPEKMPTTLHWFKWEAYSTWISGTLLLCAMYYFKADLYLVGGWLDEPHWAILGSVIFILFGLLFYELCFRIFSNKQGLILAAMVIYIVAASWLATKLFSGRAAFLHLGAMMATIMAGNVFLGIMPAQRGFMRAVESSQAPNTLPMLRAKQRSVYNNYFTLPVIFCMISNHYAFLYGHPYNWLVLVSIIALSAYARHFFNLKHRGIIKPIILIQAAGGVLVLAVAMAIFNDTSDAQFAENQNVPLKDIENGALEIVATHCTNCHSVSPTQAGFNAAPAGMVFDTLPQILAAKEKVAEVVKTRYMPLGNMTNMSDEERNRLIQMLKQL